MKFSVSKQDLQRALGAAVPATNAKSPLPILSSILIEAIGGELTVIATDLEVGIKVSLPIIPEEDGKAVVNGKKILEITRLFDNDTMILVSSTNSQIEISDPNSRTNYRLHTMSADDFPIFADFSAVVLSEMDSSLLTKTFSKVLFAASNDDSRFNLNGLCITNTAVVTTDGHRLALHEVDLPVTDRIILPKNGAEYIKKTITSSKAEKVAIGFEPKNLVLKVDNILLTCRLIDGDYPDYNKVIPTIEPTATFYLDKDVFLATVKRVSLVLDDRNKAISVCLKDGKDLLLSAKTEIGEASETVKVVDGVGEFEAQVNNTYLMELLAAQDSMVVFVEYYKEGAPIKFQNSEKTGGLSIVMPMRK